MNNCVFPFYKNNVKLIGLGGMALLSGKLTNVWFLILLQIGFLLLLLFHNSNGQQNSQSVAFWWQKIEGNLRWDNTKPVWNYFMMANMEPSMHFRRANTEIYTCVLFYSFTLLLFSLLLLYSCALVLLYSCTLDSPER